MNQPSATGGPSSRGCLFFILLCVIPLFETWLLIRMGGIFGALPTIAMVIATAVIGGSLVRRQGLANLAKTQQGLNSGEVPAIQILEGVAILFAGALLITPGFVTDALGFFLLWPAARRQLVLQVVAKGVVNTATSGRSSAPEGDGPATIEGEYRRHEDE